MVRRLEPLVREGDKVVIRKFPKSTGNHALGFGTYGYSFLADVYREGARRRPIAVKLLNKPNTIKDDSLKDVNSKTYAKRRSAYIEWFKRLPQLQKKFPRLIFNNSQLIFPSQVYTSVEQQGASLNHEDLQPVSNSHSFAIASEVYRIGKPKKVTETPFLYRGLTIKQEDLTQLCNFVLDHAEQGILIAPDAFGFVKSGKFHRVVIRDPDIMAASIAKHTTEDYSLDVIAASLVCVMSLKRQAMTRADFKKHSAELRRRIARLKLDPEKAEAMTRAIIKKSKLDF